MQKILKLAAKNEATVWHHADCKRADVGVEGRCKGCFCQRLLNDRIKDLFPGEQIVMIQEVTWTPEDGDAVMFKAMLPGRMAVARSSNGPEDAVNQLIANLEAS